MTQSNDTIFALSSGGLPSGVAVVRVSGPEAISITEKLTGKTHVPGRVSYCILRSVDGLEALDKGLVVCFRSPNSFTGEDCAEFHLHGGIAVVSRVLKELGSCGDARMAEAGEFSRRAFENEKMDLTEAEGFADLISAETEVQRKLALQQASGSVREMLDDWRSRIVRARAFIEAEFDFSDEEDVPDTMLSEVKSSVCEIIAEMEKGLESANVGEIVREGYRIALMGRPNAGKSSLLNALAKRDVAIVSSIPGTTRDILEVRLDIDGLPVILSDTAGLRESTDEIETIGMNRALDAAQKSDLILWLVPSDEELGKESEAPMKEAVYVRTKADLGVGDSAISCQSIPVSVKSPDGLEKLLSFLREKLKGFRSPGSEVIISRERQRIGLIESKVELARFLETSEIDLTIGAEHLRVAGDKIGKLTGRIDVEDILDVIFGEFCVGK